MRSLQLVAIAKPVDAGERDVNGAHPWPKDHLRASVRVVASSKKLVVLHRTVKNNRLAAVGYLWTFAAIRLSTGGRVHYTRRRLAGDRHAAAQRNLFNRFLGCLYYCLQTGQTYSETVAFGNHP